MAHLVLVVCAQDFGSDLTLALEMWRRTDLWTRTTILVSAVGCTTFVVIPYLLNLWWAANIKRADGVLSRSPWAQQWFENNSRIFTALVALTGGTYAALCFVSSNIFGLSATGRYNSLPT